MKYLLLITLFIPTVSFSQIKPGLYTSKSEIYVTIKNDTAFSQRIYGLKIYAWEDTGSLDVLIKKTNGEYNGEIFSIKKVKGKYRLINKSSNKSSKLSLANDNDKKYYNWKQNILAINNLRRKHQKLTSILEEYLEEDNEIREAYWNLESKDTLDHKLYLHEIAEFEKKYFKNK